MNSEQNSNNIKYYPYSDGWLVSVNYHKRAAGGVYVPLELGFPKARSLGQKSCMQIFSSFFCGILSGNKGEKMGAGLLSKAPRIEGI